jgi:hypothetical protein
VIVRPGVLITSEQSIFLPSLRGSDGRKYKSEATLDYKIGQKKKDIGPPSAWKIDQNIPTVELAQSSNHLRLGDELTIYGYPPLTWAQRTRRLFDRHYLIPPKGASARIISLTSDAREW